MDQHFYVECTIYLCHKGPGGGKPRIHEQLDYKEHSDEEDRMLSDDSGYISPHDFTGSHEPNESDCDSESSESEVDSEISKVGVALVKTNAGYEPGVWID
jgi:hypothetical protein